MAKQTKVIGAKIEVDTSGASKSVGELRQELGSLSPAAKKASEAANLFNNALNIIRANPIIATITALVGVVTLLFQPFKKMEGVSDALNKAFSTLSGVMNVFLNKVLTPLIDGFVKLADVTTNLVVKGLEAVGLASSDTANKFGDIAEALDDLEDAEKNQVLALAESNRKLQEAREIAADANRPIKERIEALKEAARIEKEETDKIISINKQKATLLMEQLALEIGARENVLKVIRTGTLENLKIARAELMGMKNIDKEKMAGIDALIIAAEDAAAQSSKIAKKTQSQITSIEKEELSKRKDAQAKAFENKLKQMEAEDKLDDAKLKKLKAEALAVAETEQQKIDVEKLFAEKSYQLSVKNLKEKQALYKVGSVEYKAIQSELIDIETEYISKKTDLSDKEKALNKKNKEEADKALETKIKNQQEWDAFYYKSLQDLQKLEQERQDVTLATNIAIGQSWVNLGNSISATVGDLTNVFNEGSDLAKAFGIAQVAISTAASIGSILLSGKQQQAEYNKAIAAGNATIGIGMANAFIPGMQALAAGQLATGKAAVAGAMIGKGISKTNTIAQVVSAGVAGAAQIAAIMSAGKSTAAPSTGGGSDSGSVGTAPSAPLMPQASVTTINQDQVNQMGNSANKTYVVESDVTGNQERIMRLNRAARIN